MDISEVVQQQRAYFSTNQTKEVNFRLQCLKTLKQNIIKHQPEIFSALKTDLGKSETESYMAEVGMVLNELSHTIKHLKRWAKPQVKKTPISNPGAKSYVTYEPFGVALVIAPWNYPFLLSMDPLIAAVSAGNCVVLKPSKEAPNVGKIMQTIIQETFGDNHVYVMLGSAYANQVILEQKYDYIFFTGGKKVGKIVATKAMETFTPVSLELGGKSPCIIDKTCNLKLAARRLAFGKYLNCGQTCIAPDYCLVDSSVKQEFISLLKQEITKMYTSDALNNNSYGKIINQKQFDWLVSLIDTNKVVYGGKVNANTLKIEPTVMDNVELTDAVMQDEIFGPILPIITYNTIEDAVDIIKNFAKPLALYLFSNCKKVQNYILTNISFGGGCINDTIMHIANIHLPFGGVGESGMGRYHGKQSFLTFSNARSIIKKYNWIDIPLRYQPYNKTKDKLIKTFMK